MVRRRRWQNEQLRSLDQIRQELDGREQALAALADELEQRAQTLDRREAELEAQAAALAQARAERMNVQHLAEIYTEMETAEAARILEKMNEAEVLEILAVMDVHTTARILEALPTSETLPSAAGWVSRRLPYGLSGKGGDYFSAIWCIVGSISAPKHSGVLGVFKRRR